MLPVDNCVGPIDYVERWRHLVEARAEQGRRLDRFHDRPDHWAGDRAARFRRMATVTSETDPLLGFLRASLTPETTVLDVGAGVGRHVVPLAPLVSRVTAVEPSAAMRAELESAIAQAGARNVEVVADGWPAANVAPADLVICSHVAYFVAEVEPFLRRLDEVNRGRCVVVLRHAQREIAILDLFQRIWNEPRCPEPTFADLFGVACQLGIWANVTTLPFAINVGFDSPDEAVQSVKGDLLNPDGPDVDRQIREYLTERMIQRDGRWTFDVPPTPAGVLWWERKY